MNSPADVRECASDGSIDRAMPDPEARTGSGPLCGEFRLDRVTQSDEHDIHVRIGGLEFEHGRNRHVRAVIAPHAVDRYSDVHRLWSAPASRAGMRSGPPSDGSKLAARSRARLPRRRADATYSPLTFTTFLPR